MITCYLKILRIDFDEVCAVLDGAASEAFAQDAMLRRPGRPRASAEIGLQLQDLLSSTDMLVGNSCVHEP